MGLKGSKTEQNLKDAFAGESQANRRYLYFANKADIEGQNDVAALFRSTAEGETGHAHGHLEFLEAVGDPATGLPIGSSRQNLAAAVADVEHALHLPGCRRFVVEVGVPPVDGVPGRGFEVAFAHGDVASRTRGAGPLVKVDANEPQSTSASSAFW